MVHKSPLRSDVQKAKKSVWVDEEADDDLALLWPDDNDPDRFMGTRDELYRIRQSMKKYEREQAEIGEDETWYRARYRLQFTEYEEDS